MQIDPIQRSLKISVGELARFQNTRHESFDGRQVWRAELGRKWHQRLEADTQERYPQSKFEVSLKKILHYKNWSFEIQGRIDQLIDTEDGHLIINEIKTIRNPLPEDSTRLRESYPHYIAQAAIYWELIQSLPDYADFRTSAQLTYVDIDTGLSQILSLEAEDKSYLERQLDTLLPFLNDRSQARQRLNSIESQAPFPTLREGQSELIQALETATLQSTHILVQAPTGFGKTGIVLHHALQHMKQGFYERLIYLTSKSTGQIQTLKQVHSMARLRHVQMRNRKELSIDSPQHRCTGDTQCDIFFHQKIKTLGFGPENLFHGNSFSIEKVKALGAELGLCPYALTKWALPYAEIWIGDSNYIFNPSSQNVFSESYGYDPKKTLLIIDEAHNLPSRTADALSIELIAEDWEYLCKSLLDSQGSAPLRAIGKEILNFLHTLESKSSLSPTQCYTVQDLFEDFSRELENTPIYDSELLQKDLSNLYAIPKARDILNEASDNFHLWSPRAKALKINCLDPSAWIANCLRPFASSIHMSATLQPIEYHRDAIGLSPSDSTTAIGYAPWRKYAHSVAIDARVDTRYAARQRYYSITADTIHCLYQNGQGKPIAIFFPSYQYAENIQHYLMELCPSLPVQIQEKQCDLSQQKAFIENGLANNAVLLLVLGSAFAEGIDALGGRVELAMVVSPALPEVNPLNQMKLEQAKIDNPSNAFQKTYIIPAFQKIHQALGRLVRSPEHSAKILLHGRRFLQTEYRELLADEYQSDRLIKERSDLESWLNT